MMGGLSERDARGELFEHELLLNEKGADDRH